LKMNKVFIVEDKGEPEVGIWGVDARITIEDNINEKDDENQINLIKDCLAEYYDVDKKSIWTEKEFEYVCNEMDKSFCASPIATPLNSKGSPSENSLNMGLNPIPSQIYWEGCN